MIRKDLPSPELLRKILRYEPDTGKLFWRKRTVNMFADGKRTAEHACSIWNTRYAGKEAFIHVGNTGYKTGSIFRSMYLAHRVIFTIFYGYIPEVDIDHINGNRTDNRIENLRSATRSQNSQNRGVRKGSKSGFKGVTWRDRTKKWRAIIEVDGHRMHLGYFTDIREAADAYEQASKMYHGEFSFSESR